MPAKNPRKYAREWMAKRRNEWLTENGPCVECGSWDDLEVDHSDPATKELPTRGIWSRRQEVRDYELAKCQVLCRSCHQVKTREDLSRILRGRRNLTTRKLTDEDVRAVHRQAAAGVSQRKLGVRFGVSRGVIDGLLNGRTYRDVSLGA